MNATLHPYVNIKGKYFAVKQSILALAYYLYFKNKPLMDRPGLKPELNLKNLKKLLLIKLGVVKMPQILNLPVFGHICFPIHRGYKFFNFKKRTVIKLFDHDVPSDLVQNEIQGVRQAGYLEFAPKIVSENMEEGWFEEELVDGIIGYLIPAKDPEACLSFFNQHIMPIIEGMILYKKPVTTTVGDRVNHCLSIIDRGNRLSDPELDAAKVNQISNGIESIVKNLLAERQNKISLVFSHGDFSFKNIALKTQKPMVIDWEGVSFRSVTFDFYNWFLTELYYKRVTSDMIDEMAEALSALQHRLNGSVPIDWSFSSHQTIYRNLYYLERLTMLIQRRLNNQSLEVIWKSHKIFTEHEENQSKHACRGDQGLQKKLA